MQERRVRGKQQRRGNKWKRQRWQLKDRLSATHNKVIISNQIVVPAEVQEGEDDADYHETLYCMGKIYP